MSRPKLILRLHPDNYKLLEEAAASEGISVEKLALSAIYSVLAGWLQEKQIIATTKTESSPDIPQEQS